MVEWILTMYTFLKISVLEMLNVIKVIHGRILEQVVCYLYNVKMVTELLIAISFSLVLFLATPLHIHFALKENELTE